VVLSAYPHRQIKEATQKLNAECESRQKEVDETGAHIRKANEEAEAHRAKITELRRTISQHQSKVKDLSTRRDAMTKRIKKLQDFINEVQEKAMRDTQYLPLPFASSLCSSLRVSL